MMALSSMAISPTPALSTILFTLALNNALPAATCESLTKLRLADTSIQVAQRVTAGPFTAPSGQVVGELAAFCRVSGIIAPTSDSAIHFEVWLPASGWNGKFLGVGNGGFAGSIDFRGLGTNLRHGFATAGTDTGHHGEAEDASWALGHPEKVVDFGYRAVHATAINAKLIIAAFYDRPPEKSYFDACSDGGREALMEAQRYPEDYDGILAGAPANNWTRMLASGLDVNKSVNRSEAGYIPPPKLPTITAAVLASCDAQDGLKDGLVSDPERCHFDPTVLLCKGADAQSCLTSPQVNSLKKLYAGGQDSSGKPIFPGFVPGGEASEWTSWVTGKRPGEGSGVSYVSNFFRYIVYEDPKWSLRSADVDHALQKADEKTSRTLDATDPDLSRFRSRGGKLIIYHGWTDSAISPQNTVNYFNNVVKAMGAETTKGFVRLYMIPGMGHCIGGPGPNFLGRLGTPTERGRGIFEALQSWVEKGTPPVSLVATKYRGDDSHKEVERTRPICQYPQVAKYLGSGDINNERSFSCVMPQP